MIDIETEVFDRIAKRVREKYPKVFITGELVKSPPSFPCVSIVEADNANYRNTQTTEHTENHGSLLYEVNIYSNKTKGKKAECKHIASIIDDELANLNFTRSMLNPILNEEDAIIYRMVGRYRAVISRNNIIFRR